jgi:hypothetical protein
MADEQRDFAFDGGSQWWSEWTMIEGVQSVKAATDPPHNSTCPVQYSVMSRTQ